MDNDLPDLTRARKLAAKVRAEWDAWLKDDMQQFPSPEFLDSVDKLISWLGADKEADS